MFYTIYKITNTINGKYYIGKHQTKDLGDGYLGSGKLLKRAIEKYGIDVFEREILEIYDTEAKMNLAEKILVVPDIETNYNLCNGGQGGFSYINKSITSQERKRRSVLGGKHSPGNGWGWKKYREERLISLSSHRGRGWKENHRHSTVSKEKMSESHKGKHLGIKNSQFGTCWITKDGTNKKIPKTDLDKWLELGYTKGRKLNANQTV